MIHHLFKPTILLILSLKGLHFQIKKTVSQILNIVRNEQLGSVLLLFFLVNWLVVLFGFFSLNIQEKFKIFFMLYAMLFQCFIKFKFSLVKIMISCELHFSNILINCSPSLF